MFDLGLYSRSILDFDILRPQLVHRFNHRSRVFACNPRRVQRKSAGLVLACEYRHLPPWRLRKLRRRVSFVSEWNVALTVMPGHDDPRSGGGRFRHICFRIRPITAIHPSPSMSTVALLVVNSAFFNIVIVEFVHGTMNSCLLRVAFTIKNIFIQWCGLPKNLISSRIPCRLFHRLRHNIHTGREFRPARVALSRASVRFPRHGRGAVYR